MPPPPNERGELAGISDSYIAPPPAVYASPIALREARAAESPKLEAAEGPDFENDPTAEAVLKPGRRAAVVATSETFEAGELPVRVAAIVAGETIVAR